MKINFSFKLNRIWDHLVRLSTESGTTIIITTHYIEEARQANTVSLFCQLLHTCRALSISTAVEFRLVHLPLIFQLDPWMS